MGWRELWPRVKHVARRIEASCPRERLETPPPAPGNDLAGGDLASGSETWTALPCVGQTIFSDGGLHPGTDYMHARFSSPVVGRFLSTDPSPRSIRLELPQSWNRYTFTLGNPLRFGDPTGTVVKAANAASQRAYDKYVSRLDRESQDYQNLAQLENSEIVYVLNVEDLGGGNEGSVTFDGTSVFLNVDPARPKDDLSFNSRIAHEVQHGVQVDDGMLGFYKGSGTW